MHRRGLNVVGLRNTCSERDRVKDVLGTGVILAEADYVRLMAHGVPLVEVAGCRTRHLVHGAGS